MGEAGGLNNLRIKTSKGRLSRLLTQQLLGEAASYLRHLEGVLLAGVKNASLTRSDDLSDPSQPMKCRRIEEAIAILLELRALVTTPAGVSAGRAVIYFPNSAAQAATRFCTTVKDQSGRIDSRPRSTAR